MKVVMKKWEVVNISPLKSAKAIESQKQSGPQFYAVLREASRDNRRSLCY